MSTIFEQIAEQVKEANNMYEAGADQGFMHGKREGYLEGLEEGGVKGFKACIDLIKTVLPEKAIHNLERLSKAEIAKLIS